MSWIPLGKKVPDEPVLVWAAGQIRIGVVSRSADPINGRNETCFFDPHCDQLLTLPTHWRPLPLPPGEG